MTSAGLERLIYTFFFLLIIMLNNRQAYKNVINNETHYTIMPRNISRALESNCHMSSPLSEHIQTSLFSFLKIQPK